MWDQDECNYNLVFNKHDLVANYYLKQTYIY